MSASSSDYSPSDDQDESDKQDAFQPSDSDRQRPGESPLRQGQRPHQAQSRPRQNVPALEGSISQPRQLLDQPDSMVQPGQGQSSEGQSGQRKPRQKQPGQPKGLESRSAQSERRRKEVKMNYRDVLNSVITEAAARSSGRSDAVLFSSRIGASLWTAQEKDCLFRRMALVGRNNLLSLCRAVPTKSESEIRVYLRLLEHESRQSASRSNFEVADVPAASEISEDCERALEDSAIDLATKVNDHDTTLQQTEFGENWLIDEESSYYIDLVYDQASIEDRQEDEVTTSKRELQEEEEDSKPSVPNDLSNEPSIAESDASITLLRPSSFLQLSRSLFMNSSQDPELNWQQAELLSESVESPSIFRGAFEDLHNLTISLTRRLVQVSLFQAMTRLRAGDSSRHDWTPLAAVREMDVKSALDILSMQPNARDYWATAARRCKVDVYTESKRFQDGRPGTKSGVKLTYDEVESEMGLEKHSEFDQIEDDIPEEDIDDIVMESEIFTETETEEETKPAQEEKTTVNKPTRRERDRSRNRKRKRALSASSFLRAEIKYLNAVDHNADVEEETRLWKVLRTDPPEHLRLAEVKLPEHPGQGEAASDDWRKNLEYEAEWEQSFGCAESEEFVEMEESGLRGRRRRDMIARGVRRRLEGRHESINSKTVAEEGQAAEDEELYDDVYDDVDEDVFDESVAQEDLDQDGNAASDEEMEDADEEDSIEKGDSDH